MTTLEVKAKGRSAHAVLEWSRTTVEPALRVAVGTLPPSMQRIAAYHFGWRDEYGHPQMGDVGKAIRAALVLLCAQAVGGDPAEAVPAAAAVELVHNFSLLHGDVLDRDVTRRHRRTAWSVFGLESAILAGSALQALAFDVLASSGHPAATDVARTLGGAIQDLLDGQSTDVDLERRAEVELTECVSMAERKTGALIACACAVGAVFGGGSPAQVEHLRHFGGNLGLAFQHVDDLLSIWGDPAVTGKPFYSDLHSRKKSLPVVAALTSGTPAGGELAALYHSDQPLNGSDLARAAELIDLAGGRAWSRSQVDDLLMRALRRLQSARPTARAAVELGALARLVTRRDH